MAFPIAWAVGSFIGGVIAREVYKEVFADDDTSVSYSKSGSGYSDEVLTALIEKLKKDNDAQGLFDFGCILESDDEEWARRFFKRLPI